MSRKEISVSTLYGHTSFVHSIAFNHDNTLIVSGSFDNLIKIWKVYQSKCVMTFGGHEAWVTSVAFNPNGTKIVSGSGDKTIRVWDVKTGECVLIRMMLDIIYSVAFNHDGRPV